MVGMTTLYRMDTQLAMKISAENEGKSQLALSSKSPFENFEKTSSSIDHSPAPSPPHLGPWVNRLKRYPASSWFLLRQTREKPQQRTVCFFMEHARVQQAPSAAFDVSFICPQKMLYRRTANEGAIKAFVGVLSCLCSNSKASFLGDCRAR